MTMDAKHLTTVETARLVRQALKTEFPGVVFSIRSKSYSGGASIDVEYYGYPSEKEVRGVTRDYEGAGFDAMTDSKYYRQHWLLPSGVSLLAHQGAFYGSEEIDVKAPQSGVILVHHGADYIFVRKKGEVDPSYQIDPACFNRKRGRPPSKEKKIQKPAREPLDISELIKK